MFVILHASWHSSSMLHSFAVVLQNRRLLIPHIQTYLHFPLALIKSTQQSPLHLLAF
jgi:hypothetical protein